MCYRGVCLEDLIQQDVGIREGGMGVRVSVREDTRVLMYAYVCVYFYSFHANMYTCATDVEQWILV